MVASANDIALQVAEHVGGSVDGLCPADEYPERRNLDVPIPYFTNPTGLSDDNQHTTAHDYGADHAGRHPE